LEAKEGMSLVLTLNSFSVQRGHQKAKASLSLRQVLLLVKNSLIGGEEEVEFGKKVEFSMPIEGEEAVEKFEEEEEEEEEKVIERLSLGASGLKLGRKPSRVFDFSEILSLSDVISSI
jgi:hypothetical protein